MNRRLVISCAPGNWSKYPTAEPNNKTPPAVAVQVDPLTIAQSETAHRAMVPAGIVKLLLPPRQSRGNSPLHRVLALLSNIMHEAAPKAGYGRTNNGIPSGSLVRGPLIHLLRSGREPAARWPAAGSAVGRG